MNPPTTMTSYMPNPRSAGRSHNIAYVMATVEAFHRAAIRFLDARLPRRVERPVRNVLAERVLGLPRDPAPDPVTR